MWLNRVFTELANTNEQHCFTIDCSGGNKNGPGRYRTQADDPEKQICYFNKPCVDQLYNVFISNRIKTENFSNNIFLKIDRVQGEDETFDAEKTIKPDGAHYLFSKFDTYSEQPEFNGRDGKGGKKKFLSNLSEGIGLIESQPDPDFFSFRTITTFKQQ